VYIPPIKTRCFTHAQAARALGLPLDEVRAALASGQLRQQRIIRKTITEQDLLAFAEAEDIELDGDQR
jgi:DNA-directed RNA polymerase specialized sigma24 family protein